MFLQALLAHTELWFHSTLMTASLCSFTVFSCQDCPTDKSKESPRFSFSPLICCLFFLFGISHFLSYPAGAAGDFTPNWSSRTPLSEPFSRSTSGRRDLGCEWSFVYCFSKRGPSLSRSHLSQVPLRPHSTMPDCFCQVARFQARSEQHFPAKFWPRFFVFLPLTKGF